MKAETAMARRAQRLMDGSAAPMAEDFAPALLASADLAPVVVGVAFDPPELAAEPPNAPDDDTAEGEALSVEVLWYPSAEAGNRSVDWYVMQLDDAGMRGVQGGGVATGSGWLQVRAACVSQNSGQA